MEKKIFVLSFFPFLFNPFSFFKNIDWPWERGEAEEIQQGIQIKQEIQANASSTSQIIVKTSNGATTTTTIINTSDSGNGVKSEVRVINGQTYATTTPITEAEAEEMIEEMEEKQKAMREEMKKMEENFKQKMDDFFDEQEKFFKNLW